MTERGSDWIDLPETRSALTAGDWATVLRLWQAATGLRQQDLADTTGLSQSAISRILTGARTPRHVETLRALCHGLGIPPALVGLAEPADEYQGTDTDRRTLLTAAGVTVLAGQLRDHVALPDLAQLAAPTLAYRRTEALTSARLLRPPATAHLNLLRNLAATAEKHHGKAAARKLHTLVSEAAGFTAWLSADCDDRASARGSYLTAISAAERSGHHLLTCYMRASLAQYAGAYGDTTNALTLISRARHDLPRTPPPVALAWLDCVEATIRAGVRDDTALRLLDSATGHLTTADPVWPWLLPIDAAKLATYRDLVHVRLRRSLGDITTLPHPATTPFPKQAAAAVTERAAALADLGDHDNASRLALAAFDTAHRYGSERLLRAVADVRARIHPGAASDHIRALDARLASIYTQE